MEITNASYRKRSPWWAGFLSVAAPGVGHIYCGRIGKGLLLFFIGFLIAPLITLSVHTGSSNFTLITILGAVLLQIPVFFYAVIDAILTARKSHEDYELKEYNRWFIYLLLIVVAQTYTANLEVALKGNVVQAYKIGSVTMVPNILQDDQVFLNKTVYRKQAPEVGDVVVFVNPNNRSQPMVKRIVAMPGDSIEIRGRIVYINDRPLTYSSVDSDLVAPVKNQVVGTVEIETNRAARYAVMFAGGPKKPANLPKTVIPNGCCFVLGDNRDNSLDSRFFGPVPLSDVLGRVDYIFKPAETWSRFGKYRDLE